MTNPSQTNTIIKHKQIAIRPSFVAAQDKRVIGSLELALGPSDMHLHYLDWPNPGWFLLIKTAARTTFCHRLKAVLIQPICEFILQLTSFDGCVCMWRNYLSYNDLTCIVYV